MDETTHGHGHLWVLDDGTPVHAPPGRLTRNDDGQVCCHLCGRFFDHLGAHLRRHGWTAGQYRAAVGLAVTRALCNEHLSGSIGRRQSRRWNADPDVRRAFAEGREVGVQALTAHGRDRTPAQEVAAMAAANLQRSRDRRDAKRVAHLTRLADDAGVENIDALLRQRYEGGESLIALQRLTGWSRPRLRECLESAGATIRPGGQTTDAGRRNRTAILNAQVVERIGTTDVDGWLRAGRDRGMTRAELARLAGRSSTWVRTRLTADDTRSRHAGWSLSDETPVAAPVSSTVGGCPVTRVSPEPAVSDRFG